MYETEITLFDSIRTMLKTRERDALRYIQERGVSIDNIVNVAEEMMHNRVRFIEKQIYDAQNGYKELEYKKWYPYNIDSNFMATVENEVVRRFFSDKECDPTSDDYREMGDSMTLVVQMSLYEVKHTHEVDIEVEDGQPYKMVVQYQQELERFYTRFVIDRFYGLGRWLIPVEVDGSERRRWLQESLVETIGRGVKVTKAIAAIDDPDVREVTDRLNSDEGRRTLDWMEEWQNGGKTVIRASNGREIYVYKTKDVALVYIR
jgi:hypothetical protein